MISKNSVKILLQFLEKIYPDTYESLEILKEKVPPQVSKDELFPLLAFCYEEGFISCSPIEASGKYVDFVFIRITSTGIKFIDEFN